jgi:hypothetical protein
MYIHFHALFHLVVCPIHYTLTLFQGSFIYIHMVTIHVLHIFLDHKLRQYFRRHVWVKVFYTHLKAKFTNTYSIKWQCSIGLLLVIEFPKFSSLLPHYGSYWLKLLLFFRLCVILSTIKGITDLISCKTSVLSRVS